MRDSINDEVFVSVVMPMYNAKEESLRAAIESIINQTYKNFEFIIINDGSTNGCELIIKEYMCRDERILLINNEKKSGIEISLNKGISMSKSDYIIRMDSDDIAYLDRIQKQMKFLLENPQYNLIGGRVDFFDENGIFNETKKCGKIEKKDMIFGTPFIHPSIIIKKSALIKIGNYPKSYRTEDYLMQMLLLAQNYNAYIIRDKVLMYRQDIENIKRLSVKQRIAEVKAKYKGFKAMKLKWYYYIFLLKPIIMLCIPAKVMLICQRKNKRRYER